MRKYHAVVRELTSIPLLSSPAGLNVIFNGSPNLPGKSDNHDYPGYTVDYEDPRKALIEAIDKGE